MPERRRPCLQAGGRPRDRALRPGLTRGGPGGSRWLRRDGSRPATTQVEISLGDKSPTAVQRCTTSEPRNPWTPDRPGSCRLGPRRVRHAEPAAVAAGTGSASTPERRLPGYDPPPEVPRPLVEIVPGGAPPSRPANIRTVPADDWCVPPQAVHRPRRICLLNAMRMIVPATPAVRAMEPPWFFGSGYPSVAAGAPGWAGASAPITCSRAVARPSHPTNG